MVKGTDSSEVDAFCICFSKYRSNAFLRNVRKFLQDTRFHSLEDKLPLWTLFLPLLSSSLFIYSFYSITSLVFVALIAGYVGHVIDLHNQVFVNYSDVWITFADLSLWSLIPALGLLTLSLEVCTRKFASMNSTLLWFESCDSTKVSGVRHSYS